MKAAGQKSSSGHPLRDAAWLVFLLLLVISVRIGGPDEKLDLDLGSAHAAEPALIELNPPAIIAEDSEPACPHTPAPSASMVRDGLRKGQQTYRIIIIDDSEFPDVYPPDHPRVSSTGLLRSGSEGPPLLLTYAATRTAGYQEPHG